MRDKLLIGFILVIAVLTRILFLGQFPNGFTGDEAQQGYSAYSILNSGKDEWGEIFPLFPRGFGDFKPPVYTYLAIPSVALFGLSVEAVRFPAAVAGVLVVLITFYLTKQLLKDEKIALWASFLLCINPWHIQLSRTAWEGGIGILTFSLGALFYLKSGLKNIILSVLFFGLTLYTYHSWRVFVILFIVGLVVISWKKLSISKNWVGGLILLVFIFPILLNLNSSLVRSSDVGIFSERQINSYFSDKGSSPLPPIVDKLTDNKFLFLANQFFGNYLSYLSPGFYFSGQRPDNTYLNFPHHPLLYPVEIIFWLIAIYIMITKKLENKKLIILWFILALIPSSLTIGVMNANRSPTLLPLTAIISAIGVNCLFDKLKRSKIHVGFILFFSILTFVHFYFIKLPQKSPPNLRYGYDQVFKKIIEVQNQYDEIVISKVFTEPQIFIAFYGKMDPNEFQIASKDWLRYEKSNKLYVDQLESWNLGKFYFEDINWLMKDSQRKNALIVSKPEDFPETFQSVFEVKDMKGKIIFKAVSTEK